MCSQGRGLVQVAMMKGPQISTSQTQTPSLPHRSWEFFQLHFEDLNSGSVQWVSDRSMVSHFPEPSPLFPVFPSFDVEREELCKLLRTG